MTPNKGFIGLGALIAIVLAVIVVGGGAYYVMHQNAASTQPTYPDISTTQQTSPQQTTNTSVQATTNAAVTTPTSAPVSTQTQSSFAVAGMTKYTDADFGFSFWYPSSWTVTQKSVSNATSYGSGTIQKVLQINPSQGTPNYDGFSITEYGSADMSVTAGGGNCPAGNAENNCPVQKIYFDTAAHTWMIAYPQGDYNGVMGTKVAANVSTNTMGGLHLINGLTRFNDTGVIPLSAKNFLVVTSFAGSVTADPLIQTIVATDPAVATPVSVTQQQQIVYKAALKDGAGGTSLDNGTWYKDNQYVYDGQGNVVAGANPATFAPINTFSDGYTTTISPFATDGVHIYATGFGSSGAVLQGADPATFVRIRQVYQIPYSQTSGKYGQSFTSYDTTYEKDKSHVWDGIKLVPNADVNTFVVTGNTTQLNAAGGITLAHDANHTYGEDIKGNVTVDGVTVQQ